MLHQLAVLLTSLLLAVPTAGAPSPGTAAGPDAVSARRDGPSDGPPDDWRGDRRAMPSAYSWLGPYTPSDTYDVAVVRGLGVRQVLRIIGPVQRQLDDLTPEQAMDYVFDHTSAPPHQEISWPTVVQVHRLGHAVVIYLPYAFLPSRAVARLSRRGVTAEFSTTVEYDTYVTVAKRGRIVRSFDAGFRPPRRGALPAEEGLDWGHRRQNIWATAWAFNERLTRTHVSRAWFDGSHPTYVLERTS